MSVKLKIMLDEHGIMPKKAHKADAGYDIFSPCHFTLYPSDSVDIATGVHMLIPRGYEGHIKSKSGLLKAKIHADGVVDAEYTGEIGVHLYAEPQAKARSFRKGDKITQICILECPETEEEVVDVMPVTERGNGGFGSTGR